jgi:hypothetical protein
MHVRLQIFENNQEETKIKLVADSMNFVVLVNMLFYFYFGGNCSMKLMFLIKNKNV